MNKHTLITQIIKKQDYSKRTMTLPKFERPTAKNVELGDFLVVDDPHRGSQLAPITRQTETWVYSNCGNGGGFQSYSRLYANAVIFKKDGSGMYVGEKVEMLKAYENK